MRLALAAAVVMVAGLTPGWAEDTRGSTSYFRVDHAEKPAATMHEFLMRETPYVSVYSVDPPTSDCGESNCWPTVHVFVEPAAFGGGQDIRVDCASFSRQGVILATSSDNVSLKQAEITAVHMNIKYPDFVDIDHVVCKGGRHTRNGL